MSTLLIDHPIFGQVTVTERRGSGKLSARWKNGRLHVNLPAGLTRRQIEQAIDQHRADFERIRPRPRYTPGTHIQIHPTPTTPLSAPATTAASSGVPAPTPAPTGTPASTPSAIPAPAATPTPLTKAPKDLKDPKDPKDPKDLTPTHPQEAPSFEIFIETAPDADFSILVSTSGATHRFTILIPTGLDLTSPTVQTLIDRQVKTIGRHIAPELLLPRARQLATALSLRVDRWEIAHGRTVLGTCYPRERRIRLSYLNVFLTPELRDYIILHELAHLTEPGHTPAFHTLCNRYCLGREAELIRLLHTYPWPVER